MLLTFEQFQSFQPARETYALFGYPLGHTMSPELHAALFKATSRDADYIAVAVPPEQLPDALALARKKLAGINLTIPHKQAVIPLLDAVDQSAADLHSVNTVAFRDGQAVGYNTDILGFAESLEKDGIALAGRKVLLLGYGGAASVMAYHCLHAGAHLFITGRHLEKAAALRDQLTAALPGQGRCTVCSHRHIPKDIQIVINGTPLGMFPQETQAPLRFLPKHTQYVFDAIYNPPMTATLRLADSRKTRVRDGLYMLVMQAARAQTIWYGAQFTDHACDAILRRLYGKLAVKRLHDKYAKDNIVLCGFMGSGKTTVGRKLARLTGLEFVDLDRYIESKAGMTIPEIFAQHGEAYFRDLESQCLREVAARRGLVLSLGGGAVLRPENVQAVKEHGLLILLDTPFFRIVKNLSYSTNRPLLDKEDKLAETRRLYQARRPIYEKAADCRVRSIRLSEVVERTLKSI